MLTSIAINGATASAWFYHRAVPHGARARSWHGERLHSGWAVDPSSLGLAGQQRGAKVRRAHGFAALCGPRWCVEVSAYWEKVCQIEKRGYRLSGSCPRRDRRKLTAPSPHPYCGNLSSTRAYGPAKRFYGSGSSEGRMGVARSRVGRKFSEGAGPTSRKFNRLHDDFGPDGPIGLNCRASFRARILQGVRGIVSCAKVNLLGPFSPLGPNLSLNSLKRNKRAKGLAGCY